MRLEKPDWCEPEITQWLKHQNQDLPRPLFHEIKTSNLTAYKDVECQSWQPTSKTESAELQATLHNAVVWVLGPTEHHFSQPVWCCLSLSLWLQLFDIKTVEGKPAWISKSQAAANSTFSILPLWITSAVKACFILQSTVGYISFLESAKQIRFELSWIGQTKCFEHLRPHTILSFPKIDNRLFHL